MLDPENFTKLMNGVTPGSLLTMVMSLVAACVGWAVAVNVAKGAPGTMTCSLCAPIAVLNIQVTVALPASSVDVLAGTAAPSAGVATNATAAPTTGFPNASVTFACNGIGSDVPGRAVCPSPAMSVTDAGGPATAVASNLTDTSEAPVFGSSTRASISWCPILV